MQPTLTQSEIIIPREYTALFNPTWRNLVYYGGRGGLKSHTIARSLLIRGKEKRHRILCTRELQNTIKDSVHRLLHDLIDKYELVDYEVQKDTIINRHTGTEFIFKGIRHNITEIKSTEGITICWVEEAHSCSKESLDLLPPTIREPGSQLIFSFNRFTELDPVYVKYVMNKPKRTYVKHVNFDVAERMGWFSDELRLEMEADRVNPSLFAHKWLGEPLGQAEMSILDRDTILEAMKRDTVDNTGGWEVGVDVARMGNDRTVFWSRKGLRTIDTKVLNKLRTTQICDELEKFVRFQKALVTLKIDDTGVGGGVTDEMIKRGYKVIAINFGGEPTDKDKYPNWISEAWFYMLEIMPKIHLPFNSDLLMELSTRQWKQDISGRRRVESKVEYKKRGFRSPDLADACIIAYASARNDGSHNLKRLGL